MESQKKHVPNHQPDIYHPGYTRSFPAVPISGKFRITLQDHHRLQATHSCDPAHEIYGLPSGKPVCELEHGHRNS